MFPVMKLCLQGCSSRGFIVKLSLVLVPGKSASPRLPRRMQQPMCTAQRDLCGRSLRLLGFRKRGCARSRRNDLN
jgi:hypothetical protein